MSEPKKQRNPNVTYILRLGIGAYLIYLAFSLIKDLPQVEPNSEIIILAAIVIFIVVGIILMITSAKALITSKNIDDSMIEEDEIEEDSEKK